MLTIDLLERKTSADVPAEDMISLNEIFKHIFKAKRTTVVTGAGISCNAGIPDFRSSDGLYNMVRTKFPKTVVKGQDLFDISLFRNEMSLAVFCTFMEGLYKSTLVAKPTETHRFIKILKDKNKLLRCYTQNIDSLESTINLNMGINLSEFDTCHKNFVQNWKNLDVVQLHGNLHKLSCTNCFTNFDWNEKYQSQLAEGLNPQCSKCYEKYEERLYSGKRLTGNIGLLRPDIVLYGEHHPQSEILAQGLNVDIRAKPDMLIVMGTSLKVDGVKKLVRSLSASVHAKGGKVIFINKTPLAKQWDSVFDYEILSDCDSFVRLLKNEVPDLFLTQEQLDSKKLKNNKKSTKKVKVEVEVKEEVDVMTPPPTPTKKKRPVLKRKNINQQKAKPIKCELPSPLSSFTEPVEVNKQVVVKQEATQESELQALRLYSSSKLNQSIKRRIKAEPEETLYKRIKV
ncbi:hypothetical protein G9P44_002304 [Scheffersomyces stipitis]|nr:hypothetical protein G9P44_002304 [Scheffersomyces stipitis]